MINLVKQNSISDLPTLPNFRYENLFNVYTITNNGKDFYYYNITNKLGLPEKIDKVYLSTFISNTRIPLTLASQQIYGTQFLWYVLYILNTNTKSARFFVEPGEEILYLKPEFISNLVNTLNE